jgi:hypothetical protein
MALYDVCVNTHTRMISAPEGLEGEPRPEIDSDISTAEKHRMALERELVRYVWCMLMCVCVCVYVCVCMCMCICMCVCFYTCPRRQRR